MSGGLLTLIGTPIGNLGDLPPRAVEALVDADVIAAEDTRRTRKLLTASGVPAGNRLTSYHRDNERTQRRKLLERLRGGARVALVSDAGLPGIADPGELLVRDCIEAGVTVTAVPGPAAVTTALVLSGLPTGRFVFEAFLPRKEGERRRRLEALSREERTIVCYESPQRVAATLGAMAEAFGAGRRCAVCRELTKLYEEVWRGTLGDAVERFAQGAVGEIAIVVDGAASTEVSDADVERYVGELVDEGLSVRDAAARTAADLGVSKRMAYDYALTHSRKGV